MRGLRLTSRGLLVVAGAVPALLVGRLLGVAEFDLIALAALLLVGAALTGVAVTGTAVRARRRDLVRRARVGEQVEPTISVRSDRRVAMPLLLVDHNTVSAEAETRFVLSGLPVAATTTLRPQLVASRRGPATVGPLEALIRDPFGLAQRTLALLGSEELLVHPRVEPLGPVPARGAHRAVGDSRTRRLHAVGEDFYTMREYLHGDDLRQVHWPSTARRQRLMVRQPERSYEAQATVLLDTRADAHGERRGDGGAHATLERAISATASLLVRLDRQGYGVRLVTDQDLVPPGAEPLQLLMDRLARLQASGTSSLGEVAAAVRGGHEGLLVAVLGGGGRARAEPEADVAALQNMGRTFGDRTALVVVDRARRRAAATGGELAQTLEGSGWRAATVDVDEPLGPVWEQLGRPLQQVSAS